MSSPTCRTQDQQERLPDHLVRVPGSQWTLWRWVGLRGAGFPAAGVLRLSAPECGKAADALLDAEQKAESLWQDALKTLYEYEEMEAAGTELRRKLEKAKRKLQKGKLPGEAALGPAVDEAVQRFARACEHVDAAWDRFQQSFDESTARISEEIIEIAKSSRLREAIIWQNRRALQTAIKPLLRSEDNRGSKHRQHEELVANYWQRYCVKNDTIGFFGPMGWARIIAQGEPLTVRPGPALLAQRKVYFESWCMDALAHTISEDGSLLSWIAPRRSALVRLEGENLYRPGAEPLVLTRAEAAVVEASEGRRTACEIAERLVREGDCGVREEREVYEALERMREQGVIDWRLDVPPNPTSEGSLRRQLEMIADQEKKRRALDLLDELEEARMEVSRAAGDEKRLERAIRDLEAKFTRITGAASTRKEGKMYAGRTLVYEDCRRDVDVEIGQEVLREIGPPLALLLMSARWITSEVAKRWRLEFRKLYEEMAAETGERQLSGTEYWHRSQREMYGGGNWFVYEVMRDLQAKWGRILKLDHGAKEASYRSERLREEVEKEFAAESAGWQNGRYQCPDVMIAAEDVEAVCRGEYLTVLGELHVGVNTLSWSMFTSQHPNVAELFASVDADIRKPRLIPVMPKNQPRFNSRGAMLLISPRDVRLEFSTDSYTEDRERRLAIAELIIEDDGNELVVRSRDGRWQFDVIEAFAEPISGQAIDSFCIFPRVPHTPRVSIDRLVISRETWQFAAAEMGFAFEKEEAFRYLEARRWAHAQGIPRFVFVKSSIEPKPIYVDFDSPVLINVASKIVRQAGDSERLEPSPTITVSEMLPGPDQVWLTDSEGNRYTSELRIVAFDAGS